MTAGLRCVAAAVVVLAALAPPLHATRIPAFARQFRTACSTCHTAAPKLNVLGEAFRLNGYRLPDNVALVKRDSGVPLGDEVWKDLWPRGIWPGELPSVPPLAIRVFSDAIASRNGRVPDGVTLRLPHEIYLLAGSSLGANISVFLEAEWSRAEGIEVQQARVEFHDPVPWLSARVLNIRVGGQNPYVLTFAHQQIDQAGPTGFRWQEFTIGDLRLVDLARGRTLESGNEFAVAESYPSVEIGGLFGARASYGVGMAQPEADEDATSAQPMNVYYKLRYKVGGLRLDGLYDVGGGPRPNGYGQLHDRALIVEHFGYAGAWSHADGGANTNRAFGMSARVLDGPIDAGVGFVTRRDNDPWASGFASRMTSTFAKVEYLVYPWLMPSLKAERFNASSREAERAGYTSGAVEETRIVPGVVALIRQNVRLAIDAELYATRRDPGNVKPGRTATVWMRLDLAF